MGTLKQVFASQATVAASHFNQAVADAREALKSYFTKSQDEIDVAETNLGLEGGATLSELKITEWQRDDTYEGVDVAKINMYGVFTTSGELHDWENLHGEKIIEIACWVRNTLEAR